MEGLEAEELAAEAAVGDKFRKMKEQRYSKLAVAGFVLGIILIIFSLVIIHYFSVLSNFLMIFPILAMSGQLILICSIAGLVVIKAHKLKGKLMAIIGIVLYFIFLAIIVLKIVPMVIFPK